MKNNQRVTILFLRVSIAISFLSAVADRFGIWGVAGQKGVAWGDFASFVSYTAILNPWVPHFLLRPLAWMATVLEIVLGLLLLVGLKTQVVALASCALLFSFALAMTLTIGLKAPLDYSVFTASAASLALATLVSRK